jgi:hypothetical protein
MLSLFQLSSRRLFAVLLVCSLCRIAAFHAAATRQAIATGLQQLHRRKGAVAWRPWLYHADSA